MNKTRVLTRLLFGILLMTIVLPISSGIEQITSVYTIKPPEIDGKIEFDPFVPKRGEWYGSAKVVETEKWGIYVFNDQKYLYILMDIIGDSSIGELDSFLIAFDVDKDGYVDDRTDMLYSIYERELVYYTFKEGVPSEPVSSISLLGYGSGASPRSSTKHCICEFAINLEEIRAKAGSYVHVGFLYYAYKLFTEIYPEGWYEAPVFNFKYLLRIDLPTLGTITGTVTDAKTQTPVQGATVTTYGDSDTTDSSGSYSVQVPPGTRYIYVSKTGYDTYSKTDIVVDSGATVTVDVPLEPYGTINGVVTDEDTGLSIEGVTIEADGYATTTGPDGTYSLSLPAGTYELTASKAGYILKTISPVEVTAGGTININFTLKGAPSGIHGQVYDSLTGLPIEGANVTANGYKDTTDENGYYNMSVGGGTYDINVSKEGYVTYTTQVTVDPGEALPIDFPLEPLATIEGYVTDAETGDPIINANITAEFIEALGSKLGLSIPGSDIYKNTTGPDGFYSLNVEAGNYNLTVCKTGYYSNSTVVMVNPGDLYLGNITIIYIPANITGFVTYEETGDPVEDANVTVNGYNYITGLDGSYLFTVRPGTYNLTVSKEDYDTNTTFVTLFFGESLTHNVTLRELYATINGFVTDKQTGEPVAFATVEANGNLTTTGSLGFYSLDVEAGTYTLNVSKSGYYWNSTSVTLDPGEIYPSNFTIIKLAILNGTVYDLDTEQPIAGATVTVNPTTITGPDGTYSFLVLPGPHTITVSKGGYVIMSTQVTAVSGQTHTVHFIVPRLATINGIITDYKTGDPVEGATVTAGSTSDTTGSDGAYSLSVDPATYSLTVSMSGYITNTTSVTVTSGETRTLYVALREPKGTITGIVKDKKTGNPVAGATVTADGEQTTTGSDGSYTLNIDGGTYTLTISKGGYVEETYQVTVGSGGTQTQNAILATPAGLPIIPIVAGIGVVAVVAAVVLLMKMKPKKVLKPTRLRIAADPTEILSDGKSTATITIGLIDSEGNLIKALEDTDVNLTTTSGKITSPITISRGEATGETTLTSSTDIGEVTVSAESWNLRPASTPLTFIAVLRIAADPTELLSDGKSTSTITIELLNGAGELTKAVEDTEVRLTTTMGTVTSPVTIREEESIGRATLTSSREFGEVRVSAEGKGLRGASISLEFVERKRYCMHCGTRMALDVNLCPKCGRAPPSGVDVKICPNCGEVIPTVAKFCSACGASQPEETQETS